MSNEDAKKRIIIGVSVCMAIAGVGLVVTGFASDHWIVADLTGNSNGTSNNNRSQVAQVTLGLFNGEKMRNVGLGTRPVGLDLQCDLSESICGFIEPDKSLDKLIQEYSNSTKGLEKFGLFEFPMFVTSLVMLCMSMVFGLLAIGFAIFNIFGNPVETITGVAGLYAWNALALIFTLVGIGTFMKLFFSQLADAAKHMAMTIEGSQWVDDTTFDWSFYCLVGAVGAYLFNIILLLLSGKNCGGNRVSVAEKNDIALHIIF